MSTIGSIEVVRHATEFTCKKMKRMKNTDFDQANKKMLKQSHQALVKSMKSAVCVGLMSFSGKNPKLPSLQDNTPLIE